MQYTTSVHNGLERMFRTPVYKELIQSEQVKCAERYYYIVRGTQCSHRTAGAGKASENTQVSRPPSSQRVPKLAGSEVNWWANLPKHRGDKILVAFSNDRCPSDCLRVYLFHFPARQKENFFPHTQTSIRKRVRGKFRAGQKQIFKRQPRMYNNPSEIQYFPPRVKNCGTPHTHTQNDHWPLHSVNQTHEMTSPPLKRQDRTAQKPRKGTSKKKKKNSSTRFGQSLIYHTITTDLKELYKTSRLCEKGVAIPHTKSHYALLKSHCASQKDLHTQKLAPSHRIKPREGRVETGFLEGFLKGGFLVWKVSSFERRGSLNFVVCGLELSTQWHN